MQYSLAQYVVDPTVSQRTLRMLHKFGWDQAFKDSLKDVTKKDAPLGRLLANIKTDTLDRMIQERIEMIGPVLMMYEMGAILVADPFTLNYDTGGETYSHHWRYLMILRKERERRST